MPLLEAIRRDAATVHGLALLFLACLSGTGLAAEEVAKLMPYSAGAVAVSGDWVVADCHVFRRFGTTWTYEGMLTVQDATARMSAGGSVAIDGDVIVVGAPDCGEDIACGPGAAYVFRRQGSTWTQEAKLTAPIPTYGSAFGLSVSISENAIAVSKPNAGMGGSVHVFRWNGTSWVEQAELAGSDTQGSDDFGRSVSIDGDFLVVGAPEDDGRAGSAYVFRWDGSAWVQEAKLIARDWPAPVGFGGSVAVSRDWLAAAAEGQAVYMFHREGTSWVQRSVLDRHSYLDEFGSTVGISGDVVVVGAPGDSSHQGVGYLFRREGMTWIEVDWLMPSDADGGSYRFGKSACVDGGTGVLSGGGVYVYSFLGLPADLRDYAGFANCFTVSEIYREGCQSFDLDWPPDERVDLYDYQRLLERFTGP